MHKKPVVLVCCHFRRGKQIGFQTFAILLYFCMHTDSVVLKKHLGQDLQFFFKYEHQH